MQENYLITLESTIITDDDKDTLSLTTTGSFYIKDNKYYICYKESSATGFNGSMTTVKVWDNGASITRYGKHHSSLIIEKGVMNICNYETVAGTMLLDINGIDINHTLSEKGGEINMSYTINSSGLLISENTIKMNIKEL